MATIYFDTERLNYELMYWHRAVSCSSMDVRAPQESPALKGGAGVWGIIIPYLTDRAINLRKVCSFFLQPCFDEAYKASPLTPEGEAYRNIVLSMILFANCQLTNRALIFRSEQAMNGWMSPQSLTAEHWRGIENKMPLCHSIGPINTGDIISFFQKEEFPGFFKKITRLSLGKGIKLSYQLGAFKRLVDLSLSVSSLSVGLLELELKSMPAMRFFQCSLYNQLNLTILTHLLQVMSNLENLSLFLATESADALVGDLDIEPSSMRDLRRLEINSAILNSLDILTLMQASSLLHSVKLSKCRVLGELSKLLVADSLLSLRRLDILDYPLTSDDLRRFLMAAPRLSALSVNDMKGDVKFWEFPQVPYLRHFDLKGSYWSERVKTPAHRFFVEEHYPYEIHGLLPLMFKMPQLEEIKIEMANLFYDSYRIYDRYTHYHTIPQSFLQNVRRLSLKDVAIQDIMVMGMLAHALKLRTLHLENVQFDSRDGLRVFALEGEALGELTDLQIQNIDIDPIYLGSLLVQAKKLQRLTVKSFRIKNSAQEHQFIEAFKLPDLTDCRLDGYKSLDENAWVTLLKATPNVEILSMDQSLIFSVVQKLHKEGIVLPNLRALYYSHDPHNIGDKILLQACFSTIAPNFQVLDKVRD